MSCHYEQGASFDSEGDYHTGCLNVSHCQQQSYSRDRVGPLVILKLLMNCASSCKMPFYGVYFMFSFLHVNYTLGLSVETRNTERATN